jgi:thiamine biosynthesis lipoprotein ApbE
MYPVRHIIIQIVTGRRNPLILCFYDLTYLRCQQFRRFDANAPALTIGFTPTNLDHNVQEAMKSVGFSNVVVDQEKQTLTRMKPVFIDLSSIAKGYGVDQAAHALEVLGITHYMVEVGGEVKIRGRKPDGQGWRIGIKPPELLTSQVGEIIEAETPT